LLKYALDFDPTKQSANSGILIGTTQANGHTYLTLTYVVRTDDPNLSYTVVGSNSPTGTNSPWTAQTQTITVSQNGLPANMQRFEVQDSQPIDTGLPRRFLKLQVTNTGVTKMKWLLPILVLFGTAFCFRVKAQDTVSSPPMGCVNLVLQDAR